MRVITAIAAILVVVFYVGAQSQERLPNASQKANESDQAQVMPCNQASPCHVIEEAQRKSAEQEAKDASLDWLYRRYMWATIVGVIGGLIGVGVLIWQTRLIKLSADASKIS